MVCGRAIVADMVPDLLVASRAVENRPVKNRTSIAAYYDITCGVPALFSDGSVCPEQGGLYGGKSRIANPVDLSLAAGSGCGHFGAKQNESGA